VLQCHIKHFPASDTSVRDCEVMAYSVSGHALLLVSSRVLAGAEVLHGKRKQVQLLLPRGFICSGM